MFQLLSLIFYHISTDDLKVDVLYQVFRLEHIKHSEVEPEKYFELSLALLELFWLITVKID